MFRGVWNALNVITTLGDLTALDEREEAFMMATMIAFLVIGGYAVSSLIHVDSAFPQPETEDRSDRGEQPTRSAAPSRGRIAGGDHGRSDRRCSGRSAQQRRQSLMAARADRGTERSMIFPERADCLERGSPCSSSRNHSASLSHSRPSPTEQSGASLFQAHRNVVLQMIK
jgi:hypothetical protein